MNDRKQIHDMNGYVSPPPWTAPSAGVYDANSILVASCGTHTILEGLRAQGFSPGSIARRVIANTRLIAAAPDLFRELYNLLYTPGNGITPESHPGATAAIAKATKDTT